MQDLQNKWKANPQIPNSVKTIGPIIILDNWRPHHVIEHSGMQFKYLPHYSPFITLAEPINRDHKLGIRKLFRYYSSLPNYLESI